MKKMSVILLAVVSLLLVGCFKEPPEITETMINFSEGIIREYDGVLDLAIAVKKRDISMVIVTGYATSEEYAKWLGDNFVRSLGSAASIYGDGLTGPTHNTYGTLYDSYDVILSVVRPNESIVASGAMVRSSPRITW